MSTPRQRPLLISVVASLVTAVVVTLMAGTALAAPQVSISGNPTNNGSATITGSGFPDITKDPTGVQIIQCADPGGKVASLPTSAANCDGATQNPLPVNQDAQGNFTTRYTFSELSGLHGTSNIPCDKTHYCVLWVGVDYNNEFLGGPHAFSVPFEIGKPLPSSSNAAAIWVPIVVVLVVIAAGVFILRRRGRRSPATPASSARRDRPTVSA